MCLVVKIQTGDRGGFYQGTVFCSWTCAWLPALSLCMWDLSSWPPTEDLPGTEIDWSHSSSSLFSSVKGFLRISVLCTVCFGLLEDSNGCLPMTLDFVSEILFEE